MEDLDVKLDADPRDASRKMRERFQKANEHRDYTVYSSWMGSAIESKVASQYQHFPEIEEGDIIVDAGSGSGEMAEQTAREFRGACVYAIDISHELYERADEEKALTTLVFGDASEQLFPDNSVRVKYYSTSGHEIESFGGEGRMREAMRVTFRELKPGGRVIVRDMLKPSLPGPVYMRIDSTIGFDDPEKATHGGILDYSLLSTRALFHRFHEEFRGGGAFEFTVEVIDNVEYIRLPSEWAAEFYLRKDYTANWRNEIHEKYTYWSQEDAQKALEEEGYVNVCVLPESSEYVVKNRLEGKIALFHMDNNGQLEPIDFPPTHMVIVGEKPLSNRADEAERKANETIHRVNYQQLIDTIHLTEGGRCVEIDGRQFKSADNTAPLQTSKKTVFYLEGTPARVLKTVRIDAHNQHAVFKTMFQTVEREDILRESGVPYLPIIERDPKGPPYRYLIQEAVPAEAPSAAELIINGDLREEDIAQIARHVNTFELARTWQIDTNPYNWFRVARTDGTTEMVYADGKVYRYDERWEFRRVGLLQWLQSSYVQHATHCSAAIPKSKEYKELIRAWKENDESVQVWKKYLDPRISPE